MNKGTMLDIINEAIKILYNIVNHGQIRKK